MSSTQVKNAPEVLQSLEMDELLADRLRQGQVQRRHNKIARITRLWEQRKLLGKFIVWGACGALLIAFLIPSRYASITRLMPPEPPTGQSLAMLSSLMGKMGPNLATLGGDLLGMNTSADLFAGVLQSRTVQDNLIAKFDLRRLYGERRWVDARKELARRTDISIDRKSRILMIEVTDHDPKRASALAQEYVAQLNNVVIQLNTSSAHRERVFLEARLGQVKQELQGAERDFSQFSNKSGAIDIKEQSKAMVEAAAILEGQLIAAQTELQGLRQVYTDQNVRVRATQARIDELGRQLLKMGGKPESEDTAPPKEDEIYPSIRKLPLLGVPYADLYRRMKVAETVFETMTQQYELAKVQEAKEVPSVKVLDAAEIPEKRVFPPRILLVVIGIVLALAFGITWVFATDKWKTIDAQDPGKLLVLNVFESVRPPLEYVVQLRTAVFVRLRKLFERSPGEVASAETDQ
jgi:capsule polysaccharide export protein KpsE/RkpR